VYWNGDDSSSPMLMLQNLKDRSLIKWEKDGGLYMHEQLWDAGWNITMEVTMNQFIWKPNIYLQKNQVWATCLIQSYGICILSKFQMEPYVLALFKEM
jgi:hypothetical protein